VRRGTRLANKAVAASDDAAKLVSGYGFHFCVISFGDAESDTNPF